MKLYIEGDGVRENALREVCAQKGHAIPDHGPWDAAVLPLPYAAGSAAVGGMLADLLSGYPAYALPTFIIKGLLALTFSAAGGTRRIDRKCVIALLLCGLVSVVGYWITAVILYGGWQAQFIETVPGNCIQAAASGIVYALVAAALERMHTPGLKML